MEPVNKGNSRAALAVVGRNPAPAATRPPAQNRLVSDFRTLISDAEQLMQNLSGASSDQLALARDKFAERLDQARMVCKESERAVRSNAGRVAETATTFVARHPVRAVAIATLIGLAVGVLAQRK